MKLSDISAGGIARIVSIKGRGSLRQHILDMGMVPGVEVEVIKFAPLGDPMEIRLRGYSLTLRLSEAENITVEPLAEKSSPDVTKVPPKAIPHPGLGETGKFHPKGSGNPLPDGTVIHFALMGNQNSGKTTLFNQLTGSRQHVGNFPGVTVEGKEGVIRGVPNTVLTDLPGIYSMSPYSSEELVSRDYVLKTKPEGIINIVDATNIERNLYLTVQLLELNIPMVVALNMMDEFTAGHGIVDINAMEEMLGVAVVPISAAKNQGIDELVNHAVHVARFQERPIQKDYCDPNDHGGAVHRSLHAVEHLIEDHAEKAGIPLRFAADKLLEGDGQILNQLDLDQNEKELLEHITVQMENERGLDRSAAIADMRFSFIESVCRRCLVHPGVSEGMQKSYKIDKILTGKYTAIPIFILIMGVVFFLTFNVIGAFFQDLLEQGINALANAVQAMMIANDVNPVMQDLVINGIFSGVGSVVSFLPIIITMFFFLSMLEDSGYIARVAFVMDKMLRKLGLSGRSIVPMLIGFGCTVPAVMSTRTLPSERDRRLTILLTPFMSCTAKLPVYGFFTAAFFPKYSALVMTLLYVFGIAVGIFTALIFKRTMFKGEAVPFVMELPNYRMPKARNVLFLLWEKAKDFLQKAFTVILLATIVVWFLRSFDFGLNTVTNSEESILAWLAGLLVPVFRPAGLGDWRIITSLICGFMAKESIVSVLEMLFGPYGGVEKVLTIASAVSLLIYSLLYTPCVAAIASIKQELGRSWAISVAVFQCVYAWVICFAIYHLFLLFVH
ncbi:MAG: ferrous iron transport protein B [Solobacterium sp.]|nr:ferrous iron transport protein B [Solobacterium sp.]